MAVDTAAVGRFLKPWGIVAHVARADRLYLDIDGQAWPPSLSKLMARCRMMGLDVRMPVQYTRTARGWHVIIRLAERLTPAEVVAAQVILGSDASREAFNLFRSRRLPARHRGEWNLLYERKPEGRR